MLVSMLAPSAGTISFWKKVSSEATYDFLRFFINGVLQNQWSGNIDWSQESYPVQAGNNTFQWSYVKDNLISSGSDCVWIDDITFPGSGGNSGTPSLSMSLTQVDFGSHIAAEFTPVPLSVSNTGNAPMIGTITGTAIFQVKPTQSQAYAQNANFVIPAGQTMNFDLMIFPPTHGTYNAEFTVFSDDPQNLLTFVPVSAVVLPTAVNEEVIPAVTVLKGNYPNPFNPVTTIFFSLKNDSRVTLEIYNLLGQKVKTLVNNNLKAGNHSYKWNGKNDHGAGVSSGIYFTRMKAGSYEATAKMVLMK